MMWYVEWRDNVAGANGGIQCTAHQRVSTYFCNGLMRRVA